MIVARDPQLWLLDEPHAGLDADTRAEFDAIVRDAVARGRTVLFSSHEAEVAASLADRSVTIRGGAIELDLRSQVAAPEQAPTHVA